MDHFDDFVTDLGAVCKLLCDKWTRKRLNATCCTVLPHRHHVNQLAGFAAHVQRGRWGTILHAVGQLLPLHTIL